MLHTLVTDVLQHELAPWREIIEEYLEWAKKAEGRHVLLGDKLGPIRQRMALLLSINP